MVGNALQRRFCTSTRGNLVGIHVGQHVSGAAVHGNLMAAAALQGNAKHGKDEEKSLDCGDLHAGVIRRTKREGESQVSPNTANNRQYEIPSLLEVDTILYNIYRERYTV